MRKLLIIFFVTVACVPIIVSFIFATGYAGTQIERQMQLRTQNRFIIAENLLQAELQNLRLKAKIITQQRNIRTAVESNDLIELIDLLNGIHRDLGLDRFNSGLELYNPNNGLVVAEPRNPEQIAEIKLVEAAARAQWAESVYFKQQRLIFAVYAPVYGENDSEPIAALTLYQIIDDRFVDKLKNIADAEIIVFGESDSNRFFVASSLSIAQKRGFPMIVTPELTDVKVADKKYVVQIKDFAADNGKYFLGTALEKAELSAVLKSLRNAFIRTAVLAVLFAFFTALLFSGLITTPVYSLVEAVKSFGAGNLKRRSNTITPIPEIRFLSGAFDRMTEQIEEKIKEIENARKSLDRKVFDLSVRNLINQAIISKSEDSVLKELLQIVVDTIGSERSSMLILDPVEEKLNLKVSVCKNSLEETQNNTTVNEESSLKTVAFAPGEGFAGYALRHRKAVFSNDPENDPRFKKIEKAPKIKNLVSVPLFDEGKVIGVINVSNRDEPFSDEDAQLLQAIADQVAIALQKARLYELAITDGLTGLFIHRYFQMRLESEIARANRNNETIALIMFDIDHFKKFNDTWGHQTGDRVLKMVADTVKQNVREKIDIAARYGGEEFAIIMPDTSLEGAHTFSERLRKAIESKQIIHENSKLTVTISLGCAVFPEHADTREQLICNADIALYNSKSLGRNCVSNYSINLAEKQ